VKNRKISWVERYIKEVKNALVCPSKEKKRFMADFRESVYSCCAEEPDMNDEKLRERFGTPTEIGDSFVYDEDLSHTKKFLFSRKFQRLVMIILVILALIAIILLSFHVCDNYIYNHGEYVMTDPLEGTPSPPDENIWEAY
jgi:hypothetical protein